MLIKVKRTYNLSPAAVAMAKRLAEQHIASSQDGVVELAITDLARRVRDAIDAEGWARAAGRRGFPGRARRTGCRVRG